MIKKREHILPGSLNKSEDYQNTTQFKIDKLNILFSLMPLSIYSNQIVGIIITFFLWNKVSRINLIIWISIMFFITLIRSITLYFYNRKNTDSRISYYKIFFMLMTFSTLLWGLSDYLIFSDVSMTNMLIIVCVLGIAIGGVSSLSCDWKMLFSFLSFLMTPFIIRLFLYNLEFYNTIAILLIVFYCLILLIAKRMHNMVFENMIYKQKHKKTMEELTASETRFRTIFEHAPVGIFYYNQDLIIYECNEEFCKILEAPREKLINLNMNNLKDKRVLKALRESFDKRSGYYEGEYVTTISQNKIWITMKCSPLFDEDSKIVGSIGIIQDRTEMQLIEDKVRHLAYHDNLTGLPNRMLLKDRIEQALSQSKRHEYSGAILFLDLDNFKSINDSLGHHIGDKILKETSERIKSILRIEDTVARIGGDEFVVVLPKLHENMEATIISANLVSEKIHKILSEPFKLLEKTLYTSTSIGIILFSKVDNNIDDLLKNADTAMYEAKKEGRGCTHFYNEEMNATMEKRLVLENNLRNAIEKNQLHPFFQPIIDVTQNRIIGAETLLRWQHPELGIVSPIDFIPLAEETNLILPIGEWLINEVCKYINRWQKTYANPFKYISINISVNQLQQNNFAEIIFKCLETYNIAPEMIVLEITENVLIGNFDKTAQTISILREKGVRIALDDFGTGYSSLTYLKKLELDIIKIDRAFIQDITNDQNDSALVEAILSIANNFNMKVVAEGVEELDQIKHLKEMGCRYFQGYYYSRPLPVIEFEKFLKNV